MAFSDIKPDEFTVLFVGRIQDEIMISRCAWKFEAADIFVPVWISHVLNKAICNSVTFIRLVRAHRNTVGTLPIFC